MKVSAPKEAAKKVNILDLRAGDKLRLYYCEGNTNNKIVYILAVVDEYQIAWKTWRGGRWNYYIDSHYLFNSEFYTKN